MKPDPQNAQLRPNSAATPAPHPDPANADTERINNTHRAYREIRNRILSGDMPPGAQFLEQELAELLGMSRTPVREALIRLQDERLVEVRPRHGAKVLGVTAQELSDIYEITSDLEASAVRRVAMAKPSEDLLSKLTHFADEMDAASGVKDVPRWMYWDNEFHEALVAAAGNHRLSEIFKGLMAQVYRARHNTFASRSIPVASNKEHRALLAALRAGDADLAHRLMYDHRMRSRNALVELLRQAERAPT